MSNALAIAAVTAVIKDLINDGLIIANISGITGSDIEVTVLPPDLVVKEDAAEGLNLFMYEVTPNSGWRNIGLPARNAQGDVIESHPLALDLHYLLTAYSPHDYHAEILLGYGMQLLHENSVLTRDGIRRTLSVGLDTTVLPPAFRALSASALADQVEQVKLTYQPMGTEELFRLWSSFLAPYRPTAAYHASVVLIEREQVRKSALPVFQPNIYVAPLRRPVIERLVPLDSAAQSFVANSTLLIQGQQLRSNITQVRIGNAIASPEAVTNTQIRVPLSTVAGGIRAGVQAVQVIHPIDLGTSVEPHKGADSNVAALILRPMITPSPTITSSFPITPPVVEDMTCEEVSGTRRCAATVRVECEPSVGRAQRVSLGLDLLLSSPGAIANSYRFEAPEQNGITSPDESQTNTIRFAVEGVSPGTYLVRVQVDGAESLPEIDRDPESATYNQYTGNPQVTFGP